VDEETLLQDKSDQNQNMLQLQKGTIPATLMKIKVIEETS
jgi:hypothetical protein